MIEEQALVKALQGDQAIIQIQRQSACQSCEVNGACGTGSLGRLLGFRPQSLILKNEQNLKVGDIVVIGLAEKHFLHAGFLMYVLPLISLFFFAVLSDYLFSSTQWANALASIIGLAVGLMVTTKLANKTLADRFQPKFVRREFPVASEVFKLDATKPV